MNKLIIALLLAVTFLQYHDAASVCSVLYCRKAGQSCCMPSDGSYRCCDVTNAVCCETGCCRQGEKCLDSLRACIKVGLAENGTYFHQMNPMHQSTPSETAKMLHA